MRPDGATATLGSRVGTARILLVEDNPGDARLMREALQEAGLPHKLTVVQDGPSALAWLRGEAGEDIARPHLILLDLNLPRLSGHELLRELKADPGLSQIPVVVLTSSTAEEDVRRSYELHANCYIAKPVGLEQLLATVRSLSEFWFGVATLPGG